MKELTIEQKAKAYDEALKVLHKYDGANIMFTQDLKEEMFPELKEEDEDERTRKEIVRFIQMEAEDEIVGNKWIAWVEKQREHVYTLKSSNNEDVSKLSEQITKLAKDYELNLPNRSYDIYAFAKDILAWIERKGEQAPSQINEKA